MLADIELMTKRLRGFCSIALAAGYLLQTLVLGVGHFHADQTAVGHGLHDSDVAISDARLPHLSQDHPGCCGTHGQPEHDQEGSSQRSHSCPTAPGHDSDDCSVCRHLLAKPVLVDSVGLPQICGSIESVEPALPVFYGLTWTLLHLSRGPPAETC